MPDDWKRRRVRVGQYGRLKVWAASRPDLIAMKVLAGRPQDVEDLQQMSVEAHEVALVRQHLARLEAKGTDRQQVKDAHELLDSLSTDSP